jgi:hypothetical protein
MRNQEAANGRVGRHRPQICAAFRQRHEIVSMEL